MVTVLCGTPVLVIPRAWQQCQKDSTQVWDVALLGTCRSWHYSEQSFGVLSQLRDLEDVAARLEKVLGEIKQLQDVERTQMSMVSGNAAQRPRGCKPTTHSPGTHWDIFQDVLTSHFLGLQ